MLSRLLLLFSLSGCLVLPETRTTTRRTGTIDGDVITGPDRELVIHARANVDNLAITATRARHCHRQILAVSESDTQRHLAYRAPDDPRARVFGLLIAPVALPLSALISTIVVGVDPGTLTRQTAVDHVVDFDCAHVAAGVAVAITLPSGAKLAATTDAHGRAAAAIPDAEPDRGTATARVEGTAVDIAYDRPVPAVSFVRDSVRACAVKHGVTGAVRLELAVDPKGYPVRVQLGVGAPPFQACVSTALARLRFSAADARTFVFPLQLPG